MKKLLGRVEKRFGQGALMWMDENSQSDVRTFSTGSFGLDRALGIGGLPYGRIVEIYGPESSGKTTLTLQAIAELQKVGGTAAFIDAEHALDLSYAQALGVDTAGLLMSQPSCGEEALEIADMLATSGEVDLIVIDSVAALTPRAELQGEMGDTHVGLQARMMSQALRKLTATAHKQEVTVVFINQLRHKIGVMFGSPETTTGGNALKFYASIRLDIRRIGSIKATDGQIIASKTRIKVVKNKMAPPFRQVEVEIRFGAGICQASEVLDHAESMGLVSRSGAWFSMGSERLGQGRERVRERLLEDTSLRGQLLDAVRTGFLAGGDTVVA
jgi:recombination protein RecA